MEYKNKYIIPFNWKSRLLIICCFMFILLYIATCVIKAKEHQWGLMLGAIVCALFFMIGIIVLFCRCLKLKKDKLVLPNEYTMVGKQTDTIVEYKDIQKVEYVGKKDEGVHIKNVFGKNVNTLLIMNKQGKKYLLSLDLYSQKHIKYMIDELSRRANINN